MAKKKKPDAKPTELPALPPPDNPLGRHADEVEDKNARAQALERLKALEKTKEAEKSQE